MPPRLSRESQPEVAGPTGGRREALEVPRDVVLSKDERGRRTGGTLYRASSRKRRRSWCIGRRSRLLVGPAA